MQDTIIKGWIEVSPTRWVRETWAATISVEIRDGEFDVTIERCATGFESGSVSTGADIPVEVIQRLLRHHTP